MRIATSLCQRAVALVGILAWSGFCTRESSAQTNELALTRGQLELVVNDSRPVAKAVQLLTERFPYVITYEDPPYEYAEDLKGAIPTQGQAQAGISHTLIPKGASVSVSYPVSSETGEPVDFVGVLQAVLNASDNSGVGARFRVEQAGDVFHLVPTAVRTSAARWKQQTSILNVPISIARQQLSGSEMLHEIFVQVEKATAIEVDMGNVPIDIAINYHGEIEARSEPARDVLIRTLHAMDDRFSWLLLYGPSAYDRKYYFNVFRVAPSPIDIRIPERRRNDDPLPTLTPESRERLPRQ